MTLVDFVEAYISSHDISRGYAGQLRCFASVFEQAVGTTVYIESLTPELVNAFLKGTRDTHSPETRHGKRKMALTLWQSAADAGLVADPPRRKIMRIHVPDRLHPAWTVDQVRLLLGAAARLTCYYSHGISRRLYWTAYVMAAWDSGLRGCDLRRVTRERILGDGRYLLVQVKTGATKRVFFRPETVTAIDATFPPDRELVWQMWGDLATWRRQAKKLVRLAGLTGSIGRLRHSSGTAVEIQYPGHGHEHLGNTRAVFERHYLDKEQVACAAVLPESLV